VEAIHHLKAWSGLGFGESGHLILGPEFKTLHEADSAGGGEEVGEFLEPTVQAGLQPVSGMTDVIAEIFLSDDLKDPEGDGAAEWIATVGGSVGAWSEQVGEIQAMGLAADPECADGESTAEGFGHGDAIWKELISAGQAFEDSLEALEASGTEVAALNTVEEEEQAVLVAEIPEAGEILGGGWGNPALALDSLDQNGSGGRGDGVGGGIEIIEGDMAEAGDERAESLFDLVLPGGGDASESPTVERIESGDDFESALGIAEATSEFEEAFVGFGAGVAEEDLAGADELDEGES
jgi:hypothetical protein